jgi:F-type H+-transporting ATPase subunit b
LLEEARRDAEHTKQSILAEAKAGAEAERARALHDIESATDAALKTLAERSAELAIDLAGKILQTKLTPDDHQRLIQEAMAKFPETTPSAN